MLQNWFILMPEISLLSYLAVAALVNRYRAGKTAKTFFTLSKYFLLAALLGTVVFYNLSVFPCWMKNTPYTTLFCLVLLVVQMVSEQKPLILSVLFFGNDGVAAVGNFNFRSKFSACCRRCSFVVPHKLCFAASSLG